MKKSYLKPCHWAALIFAAFLISGCTSVKHMEAAITYNMQDGLESIPLYQYYLSRNIVLTLNPQVSEERRTLSSVSGGVATVFRDSIQISKSTPGIVPKTSESPYTKTEDGKLAIGVAFESDNDLLLWFTQENQSPNSKFRFAREFALVQYGDAWYNVSYEFKGAKALAKIKYFFIQGHAAFRGFWQGTNVAGSSLEPPYLLIKIKEPEKIRAAQGRRVW
jgi:hypothetical protein